MPRLVPGAGSVIVVCLSCSGRFYLDRGYADLDGPSFKAYYCAPCADRLKKGEIKS